MYLKIEADNKKEILKHLSEMLESEENRIAYSKKLKNGNYSIEITCPNENDSTKKNQND